MCKQVALSKVKEAIQQLPPQTRNLAWAWLSRPIRERRASPSWAKEHPESKVTLQQKLVIHRLHKAYGLGCRAAERIFHLHARNGMEAWNCIKEANAYLRARNREKKPQGLRNASKGQPQGAISLKAKPRAELVAT